MNWLHPLLGLKVFVPFVQFFLCHVDVAFNGELHWLMLCEFIYSVQDSLDLPSRLYLRWLLLDRPFLVLQLLLLVQVRLDLV